MSARSRIRWMVSSVAPVVLAFGAASCAKEQPAPVAASPVERGAYLVALGGCDHCHTPKVMTPQGPAPDTTRLLSGHPADVPAAPVPPGALSPAGWMAMTNGHMTAWVGPWGVSFAANLTPDPSGLGSWTEDQFIQAMRTGKHVGVGRPLLPPMPWQSVGGLSDEDIRAIWAYLRSIPPVANNVPVPLPPAGGGR